MEREELVKLIMKRVYTRRIYADGLADEILRLFTVSGSCSCGVKYVETKKSDIPYDTDDNIYYTDIMIYHCPKCGNIDRIEEY